ncbi:hypothetical protein OXX79_000382 [Metschnikowia pulcherrima]
MRFTYLLCYLYSDFPEAGKCIIKNRKAKQKLIVISSPKTVLIFAHEVWPMLPVSAKPRFNQDMVMNASLKIRFDAMVKELRHEDDFYDVSTRSELSEVHADSAADSKTDTQAPIQPDNYRGQNVSVLFFYRMLQQLAKHPENLAAYTQGNFQEATNKNRNSRQLGYWRWITASPRK